LIGCKQYQRTSLQTNKISAQTIDEHNNSPNAHLTPKSLQLTHAVLKINSSEIQTDKTRHGGPNVNTPIKEGKRKGKVKGKVHSITGHEGPDVE
jgi:hypothetical protein